MSAWEVRWSNSKQRPYFFSSETKESTWNEPPNLSDEEIKGLPGAEYLNQSNVAESHPGQVRASHLLVKHRDSRRPSSWKEATITRTKEDAIAILHGYQAQIDGSQTKFAEFASQHSDCSSHTNGGDLGWFGRDQMQRPFEDATFTLQVGQMSDVVSTDSGVHLILRTG